MHGGGGASVFTGKRTPFRTERVRASRRSIGEQTARGSRQMSWRAAQGRLKTGNGGRVRVGVSDRACNRRASDQPNEQEKELRMGG